MNTPPPFEYPAADAREFWVPCDATDEQREEYWCNCCNALADNPQWLGRHLFPYRSFKRHNCGQHWRKKVSVPDGWEAVPEQSSIGIGSMVYRLDHPDRPWSIDHAWNRGMTPMDCRLVNNQAFMFVRRIPATVQEVREIWSWFKCSERLPDKPQRVLAINHTDGRAHCTDWNGREFSMNPKPFFWSPIPGAPKVDPAEVAWREFVKRHWGAMPQAGISDAKCAWDAALKFSEAKK